MFLPICDRGNQEKTYDKIVILKNVGFEKIVMNKYQYIYMNASIMICMRIV